MKPKEKIRVDELLSSLDTGEIKELMSPVKPLKRQMHIEILRWKDDKLKEKLAIKPKDSISKMIVEFNVANREILKIRKVKGELKQLCELLRIKEYCNRYKSSEGIVNAWLNEVMFPQLRTEGRNIDYVKVHERIFLCNNGTNVIPMVLGTHYKDEVDREGKLVNHAGDITKFGLEKKVDLKDIAKLLKIGTRMFWKNIGRLRLVNCNGTTDSISKMGNGFLRDCGWYPISTNDRPITGYFPYKTMQKHGVNVDLRVNHVYLGEELLQYYSRIDGVRPRTRSRSGGSDGVLSGRSEVRRQVTSDMEEEMGIEYESIRDEGYDREIDDRLSEMVEEEMDRRMTEMETRNERTNREEGDFSNLPEGTTVVVRHGDGNGRMALSHGREQCVIRGRVDSGWYNAEFSGHGELSIHMDEIVEVLGRTVNVRE